MNVYKVYDPQGDTGFYHVVAKSRGQARYIFTQSDECGCWSVEFTMPLSITLVAKNVAFTEGLDTEWNYARSVGMKIRFNLETYRDRLEDFFKWQWRGVKRYEVTLP